MVTLETNALHQEVLFIAHPHSTGHPSKLTPTISVACPLCTYAVTVRNPTILIFTSSIPSSVHGLALITIFLQGVVLPGAVSKSGDVASWLNGLQLGAGQDDETDFSAPVIGTSFDMLSDNSPSQSSNSSSIEIVSSHYGSDKVNKVLLCNMLC